MTKGFEMQDCRIAFVGDVMLGDSFFALGQGVASSVDKYDAGFLKDEILAKFAEHNLVFCNVEGVLSDIGRRNWSLRTRHMRGRPRGADLLARWGIKVANVANNHIMEQSLPAAIDTVENLQRAGVGVVGCGGEKRFNGEDEPLVLDCGGQNIAVLGLCLRQEKYAFAGDMPVERAEKVVEDCAAKNQAVLILIHWGDEFIDRPRLEHRELAKRFIDKGACLVIGHHPHVVQGVEQIGDGLVAYSLGDFIFDGIADDSRWSFILSVEISGRKVKSWGCIPVTRDGEHRPQLACGDRKKSIVSEIDRRCRLLKESVFDREYEKAYVVERERLNNQARRRLYRVLARRFLSFNPVFWPQILLRPVRRRLKKW
jgi:hypothetical protein